MTEDYSRMTARGLAAAIGGLGVARLVSGAGAWLTIRSQLRSEKITVTGGAGPFVGRTVAGPVTAFAEAEAIKRIALSATGGRTYGELPEGDPISRMALDAALLRSSLFTSVLAFGVAAGEIATGIGLVCVAAALWRNAGTRWALRSQPHHRPR